MAAQTTLRPCAQWSAECGEPIAGTATQAAGWILIEQPGSWGPDALTGSGLDPEISAALALAAAQQQTPSQQIRIQLIRRPRPFMNTSGQPKVAYIVHSGPAAWARRITFERDEELLALPIGDALQAHPSEVGDAVDRPLFLVCTHGSRDRCCAELGRPVALALCDYVADAAHGVPTGSQGAAEIWETSHVGGHRFAGNVVVLPEGLVYGRLDAEAARTVIEAHRAGQVATEWLRGRSGYPPAVQAAEIFARQRTGSVGRAFRLLSHEVDNDDVVVRLEIDGVVSVERVTHASLADAVPASCGDHPSVPTVLRPHSDAAEAPIRPG
ncbi:MAG: sucrase ferredoxin [Nitriliruptoraceae bacterium]